MKRFAILVFLGGAIGAILRELLMLIVGTSENGFPLDILVANVVASFLLGFAFSVHARGGFSDNAYLFVGTGVMGGLSTFSSFVLAAAQLMEGTTADVRTGLAYVLASLVVGFGAVLLGLKMGNLGSSAN